MSVSVYIVGIIPADDKWKKCLRMYREMLEMDVEPPSWLTDFLGVDDAEPQEAGREVELQGSGQPEYNPGKTIQLSDIPNEVTAIRVYMS